jgi:hypothetical protein
MHIQYLISKAFNEAVLKSESTVNTHEILSWAVQGV